MTRLEEFKEMLRKIDEADSWDAYPEYFEKLCDWYDIDIHDNETYGDPQQIYDAIEEAIAEDERNNPSYTVHIVGGEHDGKEIGVFDDEAKAINFARQYETEHEEEFDPVCGGVAIVNNATDETLTDW